MSGFFAVPFDANRLDGDRLARLLEHMMSKPGWFNHPMSQEEIYANCLYLLTDSSCWKWEVWKGGEFAGMLIVNRISPKVDALFHFTIFPGIGLHGIVKLLGSFLESVFQQFDLQRVTVEVPESQSRLVRFYRQRLGFKYENECILQNHPVVPILDSKAARRINITEPAAWVARQGSRREKSHWDGSQYEDLLVLRLLRQEHLERSVISPASEEAYAAREQPGSLDVARLETVHAAVRTA